MKRVLFRAPMLTESGYGVHSRQVLKYLKNLEESGRIKLQTQILPWGNTTWKVDHDMDNGLVGYAMRHTAQLSPPYDLTVQLQLPNEWDPSLGSVNIGMSACVETTVCNPEWLKACNRMSKVIVPSEFVKGMLEATSSQFSVPITTPVFVVPESYYDDLTGLGESILDLKPTDFAILLNGQITGMNSQLDRKNMFNTIRWLCETFRDDPNVVIVIKTNMARNTIIDRFVSKNLMTRLLSEVRPRSNPRVMLVHGDLRDVEMTGLYKHPNVKALVSLTRGEGFGLPLLEAAVAGLPVVATDWSAHKEFLDDRFTKIQSTLVDVPKQKIDGNIFIGGAKWAEPSELDFKKKIVQLRKDQTIALGMSKSLSQDLSNSHSQVSIESQYESIFKEVL